MTTITGEEGDKDEEAEVIRLPVETEGTVEEAAEQLEAELDMEVEG